MSPRRRVAILGAGASGICMAVRLAPLDVDVTVFEKSDGVGGTWRDNTYPGAACDVPSFLYSFSFDPKKDWTRKFPAQPEILRYLESVAERHGVTALCRFDTTVTDLVFDDATAQWEVRTADGEVERFDVVVSGLGQLNLPAVPSLKGLDDFSGEMFHSARWNHDVELAGRRVGVVGNGASALQFIPEIAPDAANLTVFQRTANWILPKPDRVFGPGQRWRLAHLPGWAQAYRWWIYWRLEANFLLMRRASRLGAYLRRLIVPELEKLVSERLPREALVPDYPPGCKRLLISNDYYATIARDDVTVETDLIDHVEPHAVVTDSGRRHEIDVLIFATGFQSTDFLAPLRVTGREGRQLREAWSDGARAHLGVSVSGFPNLFVLYGPNTNLGHNSIIFMIESQTRYVASAIEALIERDLAWIDVRPDVMDRFSAEVDRAAEGTVWVASCDSWYKDDQGRLTNNWPAFSVSYWKRLRRFHMEEYLRSLRRSEPAVATR